MERREINPIEISRPQSKSEQFLSLLSKKSATKGLIERLKKIDTTVWNNGPREISLTEIKESFIDREVAFYKKYYPQEEARYKSSIENGRRVANRMEHLFDKKDYKPLIKIFLNKSIDFWKTADHLDEIDGKRSPQEKALLEASKKINGEEEVKVAAYEKSHHGHKGEHGFVPELLEIDGKRTRQESEMLLLFAAVLAKNS